MYTWSHNPFREGESKIKEKTYTQDFITNEHTANNIYMEQNKSKKRKRKRKWRRHAEKSVVH